MYREEREKEIYNKKKCINASHCRKTNKKKEKRLNQPKKIKKNPRKLK